MRLEGKAGESLNEVWAYLSDAEGMELLAALGAWASEKQNPGWHTHISGDGVELTIAVGEPEPEP